jgi:O-methyltransferase domain/Dimerisation domain
MADIAQQGTAQQGTAQQGTAQQEAAQAKTNPQPPQAQLVQMALAHWTSRFLYAAVQLSLADHLAQAPKTAAELAQTTATDAASLYRLLRTLASFGIFTEDPAHRFALTPLGEALKTGAPGAVRATVLTLAGDLFMPSNEQFLYSVQTGKSGFEKAFGVPLFEWLGDHPAEAAMFSETMVGIHGAEPAAVAAAYDFSQFASITDVGGSTGNLLTTILSRHGGPRGILFDLPHTVRDAPALIEARGLAGRIKIEAGSFFEQIPPGSDAYLLSHIIHDWSEAQCLTILGNCRRAMKPQGRLLIIEMVLAAGDAPHPGKLLDMIMLAIPGGQERTEPEYRDLLDKAGFRLTRVVPTQSAASVVEAVPV